MTDTVVSSPKTGKSESSEPPRLIKSPAPSAPLGETDTTDTESAASSDNGMGSTFEDTGYGLTVESVLTTLWNYVLATSALLDFVAAWMHQRQYDRAEAGQEIWEPSNQFETFGATLAANYTNMGLIFSLLWFVDSFVTARSRYLKAKEAAERRRVLKEEEPEATWTGLSKPAEAYIQSILVQFLLLPVGFYMTAFQLIVTLVEGGDAQEYFQWSSAAEHTRHFRIRLPLGHHDEEVKEPSFAERYNNFSLIIAVGHFGLKTIGRMIKKEGERQAKVVGVHVAKHALRKPLRFSRELKKFLSYLRWVKYLLPIIATSNKFLQNFLDLLKKMKQKRQAYLARRIRMRMLKRRSPEEQREWAAMRMQKVWRAKQALKYANAVKLIQGNKEMMAARKLQDRFRAKLEKARARIAKQKKELAELQRKQKESEGKADAMDDKDMARMYRLQQELKSHTNYVINKMLIRPNIPFIVWWKAAFVFAVIFEISGNVLKPKMEKKHGYKTYNELVEAHVVPDRWASQPVCNPQPYKLNPQEKFRDEIAKIANKTAITRQLLHLDSNESFFVVQRPPLPEKPWYCSETATNLQEGYCSTLEFLIEHFDMFLAFVFFLDVFISFFTGVLDEETGVLKPPGFFPRYILPGVLLQCVVNPQMETTAKVLKFFVTELLLLGPVRVTRWAVALFVPIVLLAGSIIHGVKHRIAAHRTGGMV